MTAADGFTRRLHSQVAWYLMVGAIGFVADAGAYLIFAHVFGWPTVPARLAAFVPATFITWLINRRWTFARGDALAESSHGTRALQYLHYLAVQGAGIAVSFITFHSVLTRFPEHDLAALALGSIVALLFNFAGSRLLVFTGRSADGTLPAVVGFGVLSAVLGQDSNWDLANYHLYNPWAFLNGRLGTDLAAAGFQSYFNPLLDLPYYAMTMSLPAPAVAFIMGLLHGLMLPILLSVVRRARPEAAEREVWALSLAGCLGAVFLSELGNTMGDNTTALLVLSSLALCLRALALAGTRQGTMLVFIAGLLVGAATGLKLTNAAFAVALAAAWMIALVPVRDRVVAVAVLTAGGIAGLALTSGFWFWRMAVEFGNPLFPQFNTVFGSPLAARIGIGDPSWGPRGIVEALAYPFVFTLKPDRFGEMPMRQLLWPVVYVLFIAWAVLALVRRKGGAAGRAQTVRPELAEGSRLPEAARFLLAFLAVAYLVWLAVFAIGRYTVAMEVLLPLAVWIIAQRISQRPVARKLAKALIVLAVAVSVLVFRTWGHAGYAERSYSVRPPPIAEPARTTILMLAQPVAWMAVFFPPELAYVSMFNFPESQGFIERARAIMQSRGGEVWAIVPAASDTAGNTLARYNAWVLRNNLGAESLSCRVIGKLTRFSTRFRNVTPKPGTLCQFDPPPAQRRDIPAEDRALALKWAGQLRERALVLEPASCTRHEAFIGDTPNAYQFCRIAR